MVVFFEVKEWISSLGREKWVRRGPVTDTFVWMNGEEELGREAWKSILRGRRRLEKEWVTTGKEEWSTALIL